MKKRILPFLISILCFIQVFATHNQAGEIVFRQLSQFEVEGSVVTYTNLNSVAADRDSVYVCWGDGHCEYVLRVNGPDLNNNGIPDGEIIGPATKKNIYTKLHTYSEIAQYVISMDDPNRIAGILNVNPPNSDLVTFSIASELTLQNLGTNALHNSPVLLQPPIDIAFTGEPFMHTPNAFDSDGDSIAYELITPLNVPYYLQVTDINSGPENNLDLNEETGLIIWDAPQAAGFYTIAYKVKSYRNGELIDYIIRDMLIEVEEMGGFAPDIVMANISGNEAIIPVHLGDTVQLVIEVSDPDANQEISISSTCGLYDFFADNASFNTAVSGNTGTASFEWVVKEEHLRQQPYQLVIKAEDNSPGHTKSRLAVIRYKTLGVPTGVKILSEQHGIKIFPNPVTGHLNLDIEKATVRPERFMIYNNIGQPVLRYAILPRSARIDVSQLANGLYYLVFEAGKDRFTTSFVIRQ